MRCLVTGANGFVGRAVVERALSGDEFSQVRAAVRAGRESQVPEGAEIAIVGDLDASTDWSDALRDVDVVIHAAARVHMMRERGPDPGADYRRTNTEGTSRLAAQSAAAEVRRLVFLSTIKVNGDETLSGRPFRPEDPPAPEGDYAVSKLRAEEALRKNASKGLEVVIVRPPLVYGPGVKGNFERMLRWLSHGVPLPLAGVRNRRSLVGVGNLVDLIHTVAHHPAAVGRVFLAADGETLSTPELLRRAATSMGTRARLLPVPERILHIAAAVAGREDLCRRICGSLEVDATTARELLGWIPPFSIDDELRRMAETHRRRPA